MSLQGLKLVTFDVTNTLLKFKTPAWQYYINVAKNYGFNGSESEIKSRLLSNMKMMSKQYPNFGKTSIKWEKWWTEVVKLTMADFLPKSVNIDDIALKIIDDYRTAKCWDLVEGSGPLVEHIKKLNITVGIISNFDPRLHDILKNMGVHNKFDFVVTSYETGYSKPDKRIFQAAIDKSAKNIKADEALHIGDDLQKDYIGARAAGWHALIINNYMKSEKSVLPEHVFQNLSMLYNSISRNILKLKN